MIGKFIYSIKTKGMLLLGGVKLILLCEKVKMVPSRGLNIMLYSFSLNQGFVPLGFPGKVFNEAASIKIVYSFPFTRFFVPMGFS